MTIQILRWAAALFFINAGALHFVIPDFYRSMMPPFVPFADFFIILSGIAEIAGGIGLLIPSVRKKAGWMLAVLLIAIFPANIYVAVTTPALPGLDYTPESMWWRLILQPIFVWWVWFVSIRPSAGDRPQPSI